MRQKILFFQGFHNWTLNPFHMMGVADVLGVADILGTAFLCAIHGATVENTLFEDGDGANTFSLSWVKLEYGRGRGNFRWSDEMCRDQKEHQP